MKFFKIRSTAYFWFAPIFIVSAFTMIGCNEFKADTTEIPSPVSSASPDPNETSRVSREDLDSSRTIVDSAQLNLDIQMDSDSPAATIKPEVAPNPSVFLAPMPSLLSPTEVSDFVDCEEPRIGPQGDGIFVRVRRIEFRVKTPSVGSIEKKVSLVFQDQEPFWVNLENPNFALNQDFALAEMKSGDSILGMRFVLCRDQSFYRKDNSQFVCQALPSHPELGQSGLKIQMTELKLEDLKDYQVRYTLRKSYSFKLDLPSETCQIHPVISAQWLKGP